MASLQPDIQYVQFYIDGNTARKLEKEPVRRQTVQAPGKRRVSRVNRKVVAIDPIALCGVVAAVVMLFAIVAGIFKYQSYSQQAQQMDSYVTELRQQNAELEKTYKDGYNLEEIREFAESIGMVPAEEAEEIQIEVQMPPQEETKMSVWESITTFLAGLFA